MNNPIEGNFKQRKYFSATRNYTLSLLSAFSGVPLYVETDNDNIQKEYTLPISFGNYEKALVLEDLSETQLRKGNYNYLPRLSLSFEGMSKAADRQTNKFQKLSKKIVQDNGKLSMDVSYNSVAYDFNYTLLLQTRGLTQATQIIEEILVKFNPSLNLMIQEFPIFTEKTETQILCSDPAFEIMDEFQEEDVNIINVTMDIQVRGNIYNDIELKGPIKVVKIFNNIWDDYAIEESKLASYFRFDVSEETQKVYKETHRVYDSTLLNNRDVELENEMEMMSQRDDYAPYQIVSDAKENEYLTDEEKEELRG